MSSIFLRLYFFLVLTILAAGLSMDFIWQKIDNKDASTYESKSSTHELESFFELVAMQLESILFDSEQDRPKAQYQQQLADINQKFATSFELLSIEDIGGNQIKQELAHNDLVFMNSGEQLLIYRKLSNAPLVLQLTLPQNKHQTNATKTLLVILFYSLIALVVFFWIWPLSKDLKKLETAVKDFSRSQWQSTIELTKTSPVRHLATAYNELLKKIQILIETQQEMSHAISHELRTPLARIKFSLEIAQESKSVSETQQHLSSISEDISEMSSLIDELLNFAGLEKTSSVATLEKGNIFTLLNTLVNRIALNHPATQIKLNCDNQSDDIICDSYLIERAIQNLLINGIKHSNGHVQLSFVQTESFYQIWVEDNGHGILATDRERIFDSFVRLKSAEKHQGFGLGLAIVKRIAFLHRGTVSVEDSNLGGAKFILSWPI